MRLGRMSLVDWLEWWRERPRQKMVERFARRHPRLIRPPSELQRKLDVVETLKEWEVIDEDEYRERRREAAGLKAPDRRI